MKICTKFLQLLCWNVILENTRVGGDCFYEESIADLGILLGTTLSSRVYVSTLTLRQEIGYSFQIFNKDNKAQ